jgi:hypothetical protein
MLDHFAGFSHGSCIPRGAKPGNLPVKYPIKFVLAVNFKTSIGLSIPAALALSPIPAVLLRGRKRSVDR